MTDSVNGMIQNQENSEVKPQVVEEQPRETERTFNQTQVNEIIKKAKYGAVEDYKRLQSEQPNYAKEKYGESQNSSISDDRIREMAEQAAAKHVERIRQEAYQRAQDERAQRVVANFWSKTSQGKEKYSDFDAVTGDVPLEIFPNVVQLIAEEIDNADDVYYNLSQDLTKMSEIENLAEKEMSKGRPPTAALKQIKRLANSLKENEDAKRLKIPNEPLSQMRPSMNTGTDAGRAMSVTDYRKKYKV